MKLNFSSEVLRNACGRGRAHVALTATHAQHFLSETHSCTSASLYHCIRLCNRTCEILRENALHAGRCRNALLAADTENSHRREFYYTYIYRAVVDIVAKKAGPAQRRKESKVRL